MVEVGEVCVEVAGGAGEGSAFGALVKQVVDAGVEDFADAGQDVQAWGDFAVLVAGDLAGVGADGFGEVGLGPAAFGAQRLEAAAVEGAGVCCTIR